MDGIVEAVDADAVIAQAARLFDVKEPLKRAAAIGRVDGGASRRRGRS
jgi:hypothetical protein